VLKRDGQVLATWKPRAGARKLDEKLLKAEQPEIVARYMRQEAAGRTFLPKEPKFAEVDA
jgi:hypothetical protein